MTVELAVVGAPFLDLTFEGLERVPEVGEELVARALHVGPGGTGMQAIGASRLGVATALVASIGEGPIDHLARAMLESEGVRVLGGGEAAAERGSSLLDLPVTALLATPRGVAMASALSSSEPSASDVARARPGAVLTSLGRLSLAPRATKLYAVTGTLELGQVGPETLRQLSAARVLVLNQAEAAALTGREDPEQAARELARSAPTVVVTMGAKGALACKEDRIMRAPAPKVDSVDATGAGDLFAAAYVWADVRGASPEAALGWATLYAGLSVRTPTALSGAPSLEEILIEGDRRDLPVPPGLKAGGDGPLSAR